MPQRGSSDILIIWWVRPVTTANDKIPDGKFSGARLPKSVWLAGLAVRILFIGILIVVTARVASPQVEHIWSLYETPSDVVRVVLGGVVCVWLAVHLFIVPKDRGGYRTWARLGVIILPLALLCAYVVW